MARTLDIAKYGSTGLKLADRLMSWLKITDLNKIYDRYSHLDGIAFIDAVLEELHVEMAISDCDLRRIPKSGPFIFVANHPLGGIDGLIMLRLLLQNNPEAKIMANFLLLKIEPIQAHICPVNPFEHRKEVFNNVGGLRSVIAHLSKGLPLGVFPAGEVAVRKNGLIGSVDDRKWDAGVMRLLQKSGIPIVPLYFHARNSDLFYLLSGIHPGLRTAGLPAEVFKAKDRKIIVRIGQEILPNPDKAGDSVASFTAMVRHKTFMLGTSLKTLKPSVFHRLRKPITPADISPSDANGQIREIFEALSKTDALLFEAADYQVIFTPLHAYPTVLKEIGIQREKTFRAAGEGTQNALDVDAFDHYYHHLILWDYRNGVIAGAYRMGLGESIMSKYGLSGFYMSTLFHLSGPVKSMFAESIEIGRAFVAVAYQQRPMPLFYLWKGIAEVARRYPKYKYLVGAVSISNSYSVYCRSMMVEYLRRNHFDASLALYVGPRHSFQSVLKYQDHLLLDKLGYQNLKAIDKIIQEIEPNGLKLPILIRKYLLQNARLLGFNVDPAFNNAIDGLMYLETDTLHADSSDHFLTQNRLS